MPTAAEAAAYSRPASAGLAMTSLQQALHRRIDHRADQEQERQADGQAAEVLLAQSTGDHDADDERDREVHYPLDDQPDRVLAGLSGPGQGWSCGRQRVGHQVPLRIS
ncbi:MAG: hypothetical protein WKF47_05505 [Geodermatophilaceae bacterium]